MPKINKNIERLDPGTQRRIAQLINQYKRQLEAVTPLFRGLLATRNELLSIVQKNISILTEAEREQLEALLQATKEVAENARSQ